MERDEAIERLKKDLGNIVNVRIGNAGNAKFKKMLNVGGSYAGGGGAPVYTFITDIHEDVVGKIVPIGIRASLYGIEFEDNNYVVTDSSCRSSRDIVCADNSEIMKLWRARQK